MYETKKFLSESKEANKDNPEAAPRYSGGGICYLDFRRNSLNLIRLFAAFQVFYGHAVAHLNLSGIGIVGTILSIFQGVPVFFILSGYLIWNSIDRTPDVKTYIRKRVLRVYPELWCAVALSIISILVLYDGWNGRDLVLFTATQATVLQFWTPNSLRGFGCGTPNGALWTITVIVQFYIVAWFIMKILCHEKKVRWIVALAISIMIGIASPYLESMLPEIVYKLYGQTFLPYLWIFFLGAFLCDYFEDIVPLLKNYWWISLVLILVVSIIGIDIDAGYGLVKTVLQGMTWIGFAYAFPQLNIKYDISYGIYVYHMVVMNALIELGLVEKWRYFFIVLIVVSVFAVASYLTVGMFIRRRKSMNSLSKA